MKSQASVVPDWFGVCAEQDLVDSTGICVLLGDLQIAVFRVEGKDGAELHAIGNWDPVGQANVLSRGIVGSVGEDVVVASPLYKQRYSLRSGQCLDDPAVSVPVYPASLSHGRVLVQLPGGSMVGAGP